MVISRSNTKTKGSLIYSVTDWNYAFTDWKVGYMIIISKLIFHVIHIQNHYRTRTGWTKRVNLYWLSLLCDIIYFAVCHVKAEIRLAHVVNDIQTGRGLATRWRHTPTFIHQKRRENQWQTLGYMSPSCFFGGGWSGLSSAHPVMIRPWCR